MLTVNGQDFLFLDMAGYSGTPLQKKLGAVLATGW